MFNIVLVHPEIPPNTGNVIRLAANTGCRLHLIEPLGFSLEDKLLQRAGLDYHEYAELKVHASWDAFVAAEQPETARLFAFTTRGRRGFQQVDWRAGDWLVFGSESAGLHPEVRTQIDESQWLRLPMRAGQRSLNLSNAVAVAVFEAWRQNGYAEGLGMKALPTQPLWLLLRCTLQRATPGAALPAETAEWQAPPLDARHRARFNRMLGFAPEAWPLSYHYLALQRAQLDWMARPGFPYRLLGMVHMAQSLQRVAPWRPASGFSIRMTALKEGKRNLLICAEFLQEGQPVLRAESLYRPPRDKGSRPLREPAAEAPPSTPPLARWDLPPQLGRDYARLSGDFNPIHLSAWSARLFGLREALIHGMHTAARSEAELAPQGAQQLQIRFLRPLGLPGEAVLHAEGEGHTVWGSAGRCAQLQIS